MINGKKDVIAETKANPIDDDSIADDYLTEPSFRIKSSKVSSKYSTKTEEVNIEKYIPYSKDQIFQDRHLSNSYIGFNTKGFVSELTNEFLEWEGVDLVSDDKVVYVNNIKELIEDNRRYLSQKDENRILLSLVDYIFEDDRWITMTHSQIKIFRKELERFRDGNVDKSSLVEFSKQIYRNSLLKFESNPDAKEEV